MGPNPCNLGVSGSLPFENVAYKTAERLTRNSIAEFGILR
jgi:hypothetical protein